MEGGGKPRRCRRGGGSGGGARGGEEGCAVKEAGPFLYTPHCQNLKPAEREKGRKEENGTHKERKKNVKKGKKEAKK